LEWAAAHNLDTVELGVHEFNSAAIDFYSAMGFKTMTRRLGRKLAD
jgi:ribosomal protein S18 acetylase RimI-like enzyme